MTRNNASESDGRTVFKQTLDDRTATMDIPNTTYEDGTFSFGDYFDMDHFKEAYQGEITDEQTLVDFTFEPFDVYFTGVPEITTSRSHDDMYWYDVKICIPEDTERARLLAQLVADAWKQRCKR